MERLQDCRKEGRKDLESGNRAILPSCNFAMVVALLTIELHVPGSQSLKDKRMVLRRIKDRLKKFNVAVSEVEHQDLWQRAALAVVTVSTDEKHADRELAAVADEIERVEPGLITRTEVEFLT
jgi:uncharacterized protein YlxP (DUF503 family)